MKKNTANNKSSEALEFSIPPKSRDAARNLTHHIIQTNRTELLAKRAENEAARAKFLAEQARHRAEKVKVTIKGCAHKINVETETINITKKKIGMINDKTAKYHEAAAKAKAQNSATIIKKAEAIKKRKDFSVLFKAQKNRTVLTEFKAEQAKIVQLEAAVNDLEAESRKAASEARKAKLELEEVIEASELLQKHAQKLAIAEANMVWLQAELENREALVKARSAQAEAKNAEARAIRTENEVEAEKRKHESRMHRAVAIEKENIIREQTATKKTTIEGALKAQKQQSSAIQLPNKPARRTRCAKKKNLSANGLLNAVHEIFQKIPRKNTNLENQNSISRKITLCDCLMSGLALFGLKYASLLQFDRDSREGGCIQHNLKTLYNVNKAPSDSYIRECLDNVDPLNLRPAFKKLFAMFQRGKQLEEYAFLDAYYLVAGDGTGYYSSKKTHCQSCCTKQHQDGSISYYHQMMSAAIVHPDHATVIPFCPEPIINSDGAKKNDCERNAAERMYKHIRREHPHLSIIVTEDAISSNGPHIRLLNELDMRFILVAKPDGNKYIFEFIKGITLEWFTYINEDGKRFKMQWINDIPLNEANSDLTVNFFEVWVYDIEGKEEYHNSWVTDIPVTKSNVYQLVRGGRAKWKIENETFNTLKNQGYNFEHNFGHGFNNLTTIFALLMFLAFFIDQIQQSCCGLFQEGLRAMESKTRLWGRMRAYFMTLFIDSWEDFFQGIAHGIQGSRLIPIKLPNTS